ncbi:MAG: DUF6427 family protein [Tannerella sp.]|jgi:hypothetical protein|nr:DUF6427 family protein [Tannerella sp.]
MNYYTTEKQNKSFPGKTTTLITLVISLACCTIHLINEGIIYMAGLLAVLTAGFVMQRISHAEMFLKKRTELPLVLFLLFSVTNNALPPVSEATIAIFCFVAMLYEIFKTFQAPQATLRSFNAGVYLGIASLFLPQMLFLMPLIWLEMYNFRSLETKSFLASLSGTATVYWILFAWCVWTRDFSTCTEWFNDLARIDFLWKGTYLQSHGQTMWEILLLTLISCFCVKKEIHNNSLRTRLMLSSLITISLLLAVLIFLYGNKAGIIQTILHLPAAVLIAYFFETVKHRIRFLLYYLMLILLSFSFIAGIWNF